MPEQDWIQVTFERGMNTFDRASLLEDGEAAWIDNWEWTPGGGLTPRPAWKAAGVSPTGEPTSKRVRGIFTDWYQTGTRVLVVSTFDNSANFVTYRTNVADPSAFTSYTQIDTAAVSASYRTMPMAFAVGNNVLLMSNPGFTSAQVRAYNGTSTSAVAVNDIAGRCLVYHLNRFWTGGSIAQPTYLRFSEIGDHTVWNTDENFIPVSQDDGEPIEDVVVWDRGLVIGKKHSLHFLSGYTVDNFALAPISKKIGCAPGRSLIATEEGVFVIATDGNVYLYDGARLHKLTQKVKVAPANAQYVSGAWVGGKLYIVVNNTAQECYVWEAGRWRREYYEDTSNWPWEVASFDDEFLIGGSNAGTRLLSARKEVGAYAISTWRDPDTDAGVAEDYLATTKQWWPKGPFGKAILRGAYLKYHQWQAGPGTNKPSLVPRVDGVDITAQSKVFGGNTAAGTYTERLDFNAGEGVSMSGENIQVSLLQAASSTDPVYSIDELWLHIIRDKGRR